MARTAKEIRDAISSDWKFRRITHQIAADKVGTTKQTISNQMSSNKPFSVKMAHKFAEAFGYDECFLLYGKGDLYAEGCGMFYIRTGKDADTGMPALYYMGYENDSFNYGRKLRVAKRIIEILNNKVAVSAFNAYMREDYEEYDKLIKILESDYAYNCVIHGVKEEYFKAMQAMRQWFTDMETKAAKELVIIEQKAAKGELINVDAEVDRFRRRVIWKKDAYKDVAHEHHPEINPDEYVSEAEHEEMLKMDLSRKLFTD